MHLIYIFLFPVLLKKHIKIKTFLKNMSGQFYQRSFIFQICEIPDVLFIMG